MKTFSLVPRSHKRTSKWFNIREVWTDLDTTKKKEAERFGGCFPRNFNKGNLCFPLLSTYFGQLVDLHVWIRGSMVYTKDLPKFLSDRQKWSALLIKSSFDTGKTKLEGQQRDLKWL